MNAENSAELNNIKTRTLLSYQVEAPLSRLQTLGKFARTGAAIALAMVPGFSASTALAGNETPLDVFCNRVGSNYQIKLAWPFTGEGLVSITANDGRGYWNPDESSDPYYVFNGDVSITRNARVGLAGFYVPNGARYVDFRVRSATSEARSQRPVDCNDPSSREPTQCLIGSIACMIREQQPLPTRIVFIR